jgi:glycosyltransferase involved in cell wall biosynthesis
MRIVQLYNRRRVIGGEDRMVDAIISLLRKRGHDVIPWIRDNTAVDSRLDAKIGAFFSGVYSRASEVEMGRLLREYRPDVVHAHNLYPLLSPSVLVACRRAGIPAVVHLHSYLLTCPITLHLHRGQVCERCLGGHEYQCVLRNCRQNLFESAGYALRSAVARKLHLYRDNTTVFVVMSAFARQYLADAGYPEERIAILPNAVPIPALTAEPARGNYVAFVGRWSPEKGVATLLQAARISKLPIRVAADLRDTSLTLTDVPPNVTFLGHLDERELGELYRGARFLVMPSIWYETFGLAAAEAMAFGLPVIASNRAALAEIVEHERTGLLVTPGDAADLASAMHRLWEDPERCRQMGAAGRAKALQEYDESVYSERLLALYERAKSAPLPSSGA